MTFLIVPMFLCRIAAEVWNKNVGTFCSAQEARSRDVPFLERPVEILVPVAGESKHVGTVVSFPEDSVEAIVAGWNEEDLSLERRRDRVFLKLLRRAEGDLHVLGSSGTLYRLYLRPADDAYDGHVRILRPEKKTPSGETAIDLIRAMRKGRGTEGTIVRRTSGVLHRSASACLIPRYVYDTDLHRGYVVALENLGDGPLRVDLSKFSGKGLDLVGAREMVVEPKKNTLLYLVYRK